MVQSITNFIRTSSTFSARRLNVSIWNRMLLYLAAVFLLFPSLANAFTATYVNPSYTASNFLTLDFSAKAIEFDQNGNIYTADDANNNSGTVSILKLEAATNYNTSSTYTSYSTTSRWVTGLHFNSVGNLFVSNSMTGGDSGNIDLIDAGTLTSSLYYTITDPRPTGISGDTQGALYFTGRRLSDPDFGNIYKIDSSGTSMSILINGFVGNGIAVDSSGNIFAAHNPDNSIYMFDAVTLASTLIATFDTTPKELTFDENGNLYAIGDNATFTNTEIIRISSGTPPPGDIAISTTGGDIDDTSVAFDGINYLAVWSTFDGVNSYIYGRLIDTSGTPVGGDFIIKSSTTDLLTTKVYFGGGNYLVVWEDYRNGITDADVYGVIVTTSGGVGTEVAISNHPGTNQMRPAVGFDGANYLVVWEDSRTNNQYDIWGRFVTTSGTLSGLRFAISLADLDQNRPSVKYDGSKYLVVWNDFRNSNYDIYGQLVSTTGTTLGPVGDIAVSTATGTQDRPQIGFDGTDYFVVWSDNRSGTHAEIYGQKITGVGVISGDPVVISTTGSTFKGARQILSNGLDRYLVVWRDGAPFNREVLGQFVSHGGELSGYEITISAAASDQHSPSIAFDAANYLAVWADNRNGADYYIFGNLIDGTTPPATEVCDGIDNDGDGFVDEGFTDTDGDGMADCVDPDDDNDGISDTTEIASGSDPLNPTSTPEVCDGIDNDLDGQLDEGCTVSPYFIEVNTAYTFGQVESLTSYQGNLFAGTRPSSLWKSGDGIIFSDIANPTLYIGNPRSLAEFNNELYLLGYGSSPYSAAAIWKSSDGINFTNIISNGFGDANNIDIPSSAVFNGKLFVGTRNDGTTGGEVWNSTDGITWSQTGADGLGNPNNSRIGELVEFNGYLYAGTRNDVDGASVYRKSPGQPWEMAVGGNGNAYAGANSASGFGSGTGNPLNERIFASAVFNGNLYMGVKHSETSTSPSAVWRTSDGINWYQVNGNGFGDPNNYGIDSMQVYNNKLYAGTINPNAGAELWVSDDGMNWTMISDNGFGNTTVNQVIRSMTVYNGALYIGTGNREFASLSGGEIWKYESANTPQGTNVVVTPATDVSMTFSNVTTEGTTIVTTSTTGNPPPSGFNLGNQPLYYEITTSAVFTGSIVVCFDYNESNYANENLLRLFHFTGSIWEDVTTTGYPDTLNNVICGTTSTLSPFIIAEATDPGPRLANISTRGPVQTGDSVMIGGFIISGSASRSVLIRGFGPTLADWGVTGAMANPYIELYSGQTLIATNDNWQTPITQCDAPAVSCGTPQDIQATGKDACTVATTGCSQDAAILVTLPPGAYTAIMRGVGGGTGVGLIGVDDNDTSTLSKLVNISTRGPVLTGDSVMIGGFIVSGGSSKTVLIRGFGPTLADWGVTGAMANPYVELYSGQTMIATNDNWQTPITQCDAPAILCGTPQDIQATGKDACSVATTGCSQDAAILVTLPPGAYTAIVRGVSGGTGVGLVGIDEIGP